MNVPRQNCKVSLLSGPRERLSPNQRWAAMQYNEVLAHRIVAEVARSSVDGGALQAVMLHEVARRLRIDEASAEAGMHRAVGEGWLIVEGCSLFRIRLTGTGRALSSSGH
jgi:hypothetical protein